MNYKYFYHSAQELENSLCKRERPENYKSHIYPWYIIYTESCDPHFIGSSRFLDKEDVKDIDSMIKSLEATIKETQTRITWLKNFRNKNS